MTYNLHGNTFSPVGLWQLTNSSLADSSGNGRTLSILSGTARVTRPMPRGPVTYGFDQLTLGRSSNDAGLTISGDMTVEFLVVPNEFAAGTTYYFVSFTLTSAVEAANTQYAIGITSPASQSDGRLIFRSESGAGIATTYQTTAALRIGALNHVAARRQSDQVSFFINGKQAGATSGVLTTPTGGTTARLCIGGLDTANQPLGAIWSVKLHNTALSDANILSDYNDCMGDEWPRVSP